MRDMSVPEWGLLARVFGRIGVLSFGGPAAQIALMHKELVERHRWLSEDGFLRALSLCMLLPGPEAMQLATYAGWRLRGTLGGLLAGLLFVLPGAAVILALAFGYAYFGQLPLVQAAFMGIKAAVIVVVFQALRNLGRKALHGRAGWVLAALAFVALFVFGLPFPLIILGAGLWGAFGATGHGSVVESEGLHHRPARPFGVIGLWVALWASPLLFVWGMGNEFRLRI